VADAEPSKVVLAKQTMRDALLVARRARTSRARADAESGLCDRVLALPELHVPSTVGCYVSMGGEPGTRTLLDRLYEQRHTVLLPVLLPTFDLDWARYEPEHLHKARLGITEPTGAPLGVDAIADATVVICPGLAVDVAGARLGRGGGSYDRALARLPEAALRVVLLYDGEIVDRLPTDDHDQRVDVAITPTETRRLLPPEREP
jgi:5-formyltetrahydrofolate cyclo-ligase